MTNEAIIVAAGGWILAIGQFLWASRGKSRQEDAKLLEQTLGYFERGTQARSIALSLVEGVWIDRRKHLDIIVPVLVSQLIFLLRSAEDYAQEERNAIRLLGVLHKALPFAEDPEFERREVLSVLLDAAATSTGIGLSQCTLKRWFETFGGDGGIFDTERVSSIDKKRNCRAEKPWC